MWEDFAMESLLTDLKIDYALGLVCFWSMLFGFDG